MTALQAVNAQRAATEQDDLLIWVVLKGPDETFVARVMRAGPDRLRTLPGWLEGKTLDALRAQIPPFLACIPRAGDDEPEVIEIWL